MLQKNLYVVFSATPYRMGRAIRAVTRFEYNHVSLALNETGALYSFARKYGNVPLCGGFVEESPLRYRNRGRRARICVCRIPVTEEQYAAVVHKLNTIKLQKQIYVYNLFSAAAAPLHRRISLPQSYTCVEFVVALLAEGGVLRGGEHFWSISALMKQLAPFEVYRGPFPKLEHSLWKNDSFPHHRGQLAAIALTSFALGRLAVRLVKEKVK